MEISQHSSLVIDGKLYNWGGGRPNMPSIFAIGNLTSFVDVFDIPSLSWSRVPTVGIPPTAVSAYSCTSINDVIYFFGGYCQPDDSYHNSLFTLSTSSNTWNQIFFYEGEVSPMKKYGHGMVSFSNDKGDYLLTIGGFGPTSTSKSSSAALYTPSPSLPNKCFTNETHILHISPLPVLWSVPMVTGTPPTPSAFFSLDILPNTSTAIMFGGQAVDHTGLHCTNNVYLVTCTKEQVDYIKVEFTGGNCPMGRSQHSSTVITADNSPYLLVMGGADDNFQTLGDSWILDINNKTWKKIEIPGSVAFRFDHSTTNFMISDNLFWIIVRGGYRQCNTRNNATQFVTGADTTVIVELVYSNGEWSVTGMWNNELIANHSIRLTLLDKLREGTISSSVIRRLETEQLKKNMTGTQEENERLQSELRASDDQAEGYIKLLDEEEMKLEETIGLEEVHRKITVGKHQEIEGLSDLLSDPATKPGSSKKRPKDESDIQFKKMKMSDDDDYDVTDVTTQESNPCEHEPMEGIDNFKASIDDKTLDVGVQFNYITLETDHLRGVTISNSKLFTVHGDLSQRQSLVWKDHGFELHFPVNTCLPGEECEVTVDAVVGGDFVFPEGVEPVSAIFIISVTSKLRKPSLLRMKHCVALEKISKQSCLSFYRASLKEQKPPYHFRKLKGGFFDLKSQFGELELPAFCSLTVCKDSGASSGDEATSDSQSVEGMSTSSGFCSESEQEVSAPTQDGRMSQSSARINDVDDSVMYSCQAFYLKIRPNEWHLKFIVVKNIDAFKSYVKSELKHHEADVAVDLMFSDDHVRFDLVKECLRNFKGWDIEPHSDPLALSMKRASQFGYEREVSVPPTCLVTVVGDNSVPDYTKRLHCPVLLRGVSTVGSEQESKIFIKRTMSEKDDENLVEVQQNPTIPNKEQVAQCIKEEIKTEFANLQTLFSDEDNLKFFAGEMLAADIIPHHATTNPSFNSIINAFFCGFSFLESIEEIEDCCNKFFNAFHKLGGPFVKAANKVKKHLKSSVMEKLNVSLNIQ